MNQLKLSTRTLLLCALLLLLVLIGGPVGYRFGPIPLMPSLVSILLAVAGGAAVLAVGLFYLVDAIRKGRGGDRNILLVAMVLSVFPFVMVMPYILAARSLPPIHDITTDMVNPPAFVALLEERKKAPNGADYGASEQWPAEKLGQAQEAAYPDIGPLMSSLEPAQALARAEHLAEGMGLDVIAVDAGSGLIEATATTFWFGFKDDLVIRVAGAANGSRIDIRSMSRIGQSDLGANAARIAEFIQRFESG